MNNHISLIGRKFNRLMVTNNLPNKNGYRMVRAICDCGNEWTGMAKALISGNTKSCGCLHREATSLKTRKPLKTGSRFGKLVVIENLPTRNGKGMVNCICDCGKTVTLLTASLLSGGTRYCGCLHNELLKERVTKHGMSKSSLYDVYQNMKSRCENPKSKAYNNYGGRGITVCKEWSENPTLFLEWAIKNGYERGLDIDRINNDRGYEPNNCRFVTRSINMRNTRRNMFLTINGETKLLVEWAELTGVRYGTLKQRVYRNKTSEQPVEIFK